MNSGIIATRYSTALLALIRENGTGERVFSQVKTLLSAVSQVPCLRKVLSDPALVSPSEKVRLLDMALDPEKPEDDLHRFFELLAANNRIGDIELVLQTFVSLYRKSMGIRRGRLVIPERFEDIDALQKKIEDIIGIRDGESLELEVVVDPSIIGGFVFELDDRLLDASVSHQLDLIRRQYAERNRRLV